MCLSVMSLKYQLFISVKTLLALFLSFLSVCVIFLLFFFFFFGGGGGGGVGGSSKQGRCALEYLCA